MIISMIAARSANGVIGKNNALVWHLPADLQYFKKTTEGHHIVMGRRTCESIDRKPLPKRTNIVLTQQKNWQAEGFVVVNHLEEAIFLAKKNGEKELFIVGGSDLYRLGLAKGDRLYLTEIRENFDGDTFFPEIPSNWIEVSRQSFEPDEKNVYAYDFVIFERKR